MLVCYWFNVTLIQGLTVPDVLILILNRCIINVYSRPIAYSIFSTVYSVVLSGFPNLENVKNVGRQVA